MKLSEIKLVYVPELESNAFRLCSCWFNIVFWMAKLNTALLPT